MSYDLSKIMTVHPGGYNDIMETLARKGATMIHYTEQKVMRDEKDPQKMVVKTIGHQIASIDIHDEIEKTVEANLQFCTGMVASAIQGILAKYGLPDPTKPKWLEPTEMWFV